VEFVTRGRDRRARAIHVCSRVQCLSSPTISCSYALYLRGFANAPIRDVRLTDCDFGDVAKANVAEHVEGLSLRNVRMNGKAVDR